MIFGITCEPVVNMRRTPSELSEVVSQTLYSEKIGVLSQEGNWSLIQTPDGYSGWVLSDSFSVSLSYQTSCIVCRPSAHLYREKSLYLAPVLTLPFGVGLMVEEEKDDPLWAQVKTPCGDSFYIQKGNFSLPYPIRRSEWGNFSRQFLGLPYTWGGRSSFGYDCSGFVQMLYTQMGVLLPRDSHLQAVDPRFKSVGIEQLEMGDLIFWGLDPCHIKHVGMFLGEDVFIHATAKENKPWLRLNHLTDPVWSGLRSAPYPYRMTRSLG